MDTIPTTKEVDQYAIKKVGTEEWKTYRSVSAISKELNLNRHSLKAMFDKKMDSYNGYEGKIEKIIKKLSDSDRWKLANPERTKDNNKTHNSKKLVSTKSTVVIIMAKKPTDEKWLEFDSQIKASKALGVANGNITKVIQGKLNKTGGSMLFGYK